MEGEFLLSERHKRIIEKNFVFISYCWNNQEVYDRVQKLVKYLRANQINVLYDEGGLEYGENTSAFETMILHQNCKLVLVVCDKAYKERATKGIGGVSEEFPYILQCYSKAKNKEKFILLKVDATLTIFGNSIYANFKDDSEFEKIKNKVASALQDESSEDTLPANPNSAYDYFWSAMELASDSEFAVVIKKINKALQKYNQDKLSDISLLLQIYNLGCYCGVKNNQKDVAINFAKKMLSIMPRNYPIKHKLVYMGNSALAFRFSPTDSDDYDNYEKYAREAYTLSTRCNVDVPYYASMLSSALYENKQYLGAYNYANEALAYFESEINDPQNIGSFSRTTYLKYQCNLVEITCAYSKTLKARTAEINHLLSAQKLLIDIINSIQNSEDELDDDTLKSEIYRVASMLFESLSNLYCKR